MLNPYKPQLAKILGLKNESRDSRLFILKLQRGKALDFIPGQFLMLGIPGFGEAPFDICSSPRQKRFFEICVRKAGLLTQKIFELKKNDYLTCRGPYGNGFAHLEHLSPKNLLLVGGGTGFITSRGLIKDIIDKKLYKTRKIQVFYGARTEDVLLFRDEYNNWRKYIDLQIALECPPKAMRCVKGMLTDLMEQAGIIEDASVIMCGPPIMYKFCIQKLQSLKGKNFPDKNIYLFLERRMHCAIGVCQHCAIGPYYVCKDGPVFNWAEIQKVPEAI